MIIIKAIIGSGGACVLLLIFDLGLWSVIMASNFSVLIALIFGVWRFNKKNLDSKIIFKLNKDLLKDFFNYSYKLYVSGLMGYLNNYSMKLILSIFLSPSKVAFFSLAQERANLLSKIPDAVNLLLYPRVSSSEEEESSLKTVKAFRILLILSFFSSILLAIFIYPLVLLMYGKAYIPMVIPFIIVLPGILVHGTSSVFVSYFNGIGRSDLTMKLSVFPLISQLIFGIIFINYFGIIGAAFSFTLAMFFFGFLKIFFFIKTSKISLKEHIPVSSDYIYIFNFFKLKVIKS